VKREAENPIVKSGKSEEESNMATPRSVRKGTDQGQNVGEVEVSDVLATRATKELIVQWFVQRTGDRV